MDVQSTHPIPRRYIEPAQDGMWELARVYRQTVPVQAFDTVASGRPAIMGNNALVVAACRAGY